jgi:tetratricopeptide (TPR) repeat protein
MHQYMPTYLDSNHSHPHENKQIPFNEGQNFGLTDQPADDDLSKRAAALLKEGQLDQAAKLLDEILAHDEMRVDQAARNNFNRAQAYKLQYQPVKALPLYEKAYR